MHGSINKSGDGCSPYAPIKFGGEFFGAHVRGQFVIFRYFDPFADSVFVVGSFNGWNESLKMTKTKDGVFTAMVTSKSCPDGSRYKYKVYSGGEVIYVCDPYGERTDGEPFHNSIVCNTAGYVWGDGAFLASHRAIYENGTKNQPLHAYELSLEHWCSQSSEQVTYESAAAELSMYVRQMGYTHVIIDDVFSRYYVEKKAMFYAPNTRFGDASGFRRFVDIMHKARVGVIVDWNFDDGRDIYSRHELCVGTVLYWMCNYHIDGVALTVSDKRGEDIARRADEDIKAASPGALVIVRGNGQLGTLWDTSSGDAILDSFASDFDLRRPVIEKKSNAREIIASFGRRRYIGVFPGDEWRVFAASRAAFASLIAAKGKKSTYMGCEIGMKKEGKIAWDVLDGAYNAGLQLCHSDLGEIYLSHPALWRDDSFCSTCKKPCDDGVVLFERAFGTERLLIIVNLSVNAYENRSFEVIEGGRYEEIFNSDSLRYGGSGVVNGRSLSTTQDGDKNVICGVRVPPLAVAILKLKMK